MFEIISLFPDAFPGTLDYSILKKARGKKWDMRVLDMREFGIGKHKRVDDEVFSGIPGMLIRPDVVDLAMQCVDSAAKRIFLSPRGKKFDQKKAEEMAASEQNFVLLCGRYEGVDQRAIDYFDFEEVSIGDFVLAGAEVAALAMMEAVIRKIPGVIGNAESFKHETFTNNEISEPRFTRPSVWETKEGNTIAVPDILLSGNHKEIELFQKNQRKSINNK